MDGALQEVPTSLKARFLDAMSRGVSMVNVVTTDGEAGRFGATVSAMSAVSADMDPPTLLVCLNQGGATAQAIVRNRTFCLNFLHESQSAVADCLAGRARTASGDKFDCATWSRSGLAHWRLAGALASFDCHVLKAEPVGAHLVIFGSADAIGVGDVGRALLYGARAYCAPSSLASAEPAHRRP